jgi:mono/diheme cytochrome c family protein
MTPTPTILATILSAAALAAEPAASAEPTKPEPAKPAESAKPAAPLPGQAVFSIYCAACHGPEGAGLVGPNLTDTVFLHGGRRQDLLLTISKGVDGKGMPAWEAILSKEQLEQVADYAFSLIGKNLPSPIAVSNSTVTPFPKGSPVRPLLMRSFMPTQGLGEEVFPHYHRGTAVAKYSPEAGEDVEGTVKPVSGVPTALAVNFGDQLSYCFDTTECRLLYTWSGGFMDMTKYWGPGSGGNRKGFDYVPVVMGTMAYATKGPEPLRIPGVAATAPAFRGYRKVKGVPQLEYAIGPVAFAVTISPGAVAGTAVCRTTASGAPQGLVYAFHPAIAKQIACDRGTRDGDTLTLSAAEAADFTLTIAPAAH